MTRKLAISYAKFYRQITSRRDSRLRWRGKRDRFGCPPNRWERHGDANLLQGFPHGPRRAAL